MSESTAPSTTLGVDEFLQPVRVQILHVPDCPLVDNLRALVARCLTQSAVSVAVEEIEGPYPSPTLLVNGKDATGRPIVDAPSCRLDLPSEEQILAALAEACASTLQPGDALRSRARVAHGLRLDR